MALGAQLTKILLMTTRSSLPRSGAELQRMIDDAIQESVHLDYKRSDSLLSQSGRKEVSKDVSSFLNSDGGVIVFGILEDNHIPVSIDSGVPHATFTRERLEQLILSNISPRPDGIEVVQIDVSPTSAAYAVEIPKGYRPYQDTQQSRYYKRFNFQSVPMEHYEIEDLRTRHTSLERLVNVDVRTRHGFLLYVVVSNPGAKTANDVRFRIEPELHWSGGTKPRLLDSGTLSLNPGREFYFLYDSFFEILNPERKKVTQFVVTVTYRHPLSETTVEESFQFDLQDYLNTAVLEGEAIEAGKKVETVLKEIRDDIRKLNENVHQLTSIASPTGLNLSFTALRNLAQLRKPEPDFVVDSNRYITIGALRELLEIDWNLAYRIHLVVVGQDKTPIDAIEGVTIELIQKLRKFVDFPHGA